MPRLASLRSWASRASARSVTRPAAARPYSPAIDSAWASLSRPARKSWCGSPTSASARRPAASSATLGWSPSSPAMRSRMAVSCAMPDGSGGLAGSPPAAAATASTSASAAAGSPRPRSNRGRSAGSTQTSGAAPALAAARSRSWAAGPAPRSSTVTSPPAASRHPASMVSSADQPASVPPATSTRSRSAASATPYHRGWSWYRRPRACQSRNRRSCSCCQPCHCWSRTALARATRRCSWATRAANSRRPSHTPRAHQTASSMKQPRPATVSAAFSTPSRPSTAASPASPRPDPPPSHSGRLSRRSSRCCAASQPGLSCSGPGSAGRSGGGPGSGCSSAYSQPR